MKRFDTAAVLFAALLAAGSANAQSVLDVAGLEELDGADIVGPDGSEIGEIDEILIDESGRVVAFAVEIGGFLDIGDEERVFAVDQLTYEDGDYVTDLSEKEMQALPEYD